MDINYKETGKYILHVLLISTISAIIAMLQSYVQTHGIETLPVIHPENTAIIGAGIGAITRSLKMV